MSSSAQGGPVAPQQGKKQGVGKKLLTRVKTVLKRADPSKRRSTILPTPVAQAAASTTEAGPTTAAQIVASTTSQPISAPTPAPAATHPAATVPAPTPKQSEQQPSAPFNGQRISRSQIYEERARRLAERYGLTLQPDNWYSTEGHVQRIEKPIRMRVHRKCHHCDVYFGAAKECPKCGHKFCKECERYPQRRTEAERIASRERRAAANHRLAMDRAEKDRQRVSMIVPDSNPNPLDNFVLRRPPLQPGGQELVHKPIRQRVRRTCCKCLDRDTATLFTRGKRECPKCDHKTCTDCPRDPPAREKYPYGYPGDELGDKSTPHYRCHECKAKFLPGAQEGIKCPKCSHQKCSSCKQIRPHKVEPKPDPEILKSVEEKMAALRFR